jgi:hypothetical protein
MRESVTRTLVAAAAGGTALCTVMMSVSDVSAAAPVPHNGSGLFSGEASAIFLANGCHPSRHLAARAPGTLLPDGANAVNGADSAGTPMILSAADEATPESTIPEQHSAEAPPAPEADGDGLEAPRPPEVSDGAQTPDAPEIGGDDEVPEPPVPAEAEE